MEKDTEDILCVGLYEKGNVVVDYLEFLCVFPHFREWLNIFICLLTESGPCNIFLTGLSRAVCFQ